VRNEETDYVIVYEADYVVLCETDYVVKSETVFVVLYENASRSRSRENTHITCCNRFIRIPQNSWGRVATLIIRL